MKNEISKNKKTKNSRFVVVSDNLLGNAIPEKTKKATKYGLNIFNGERPLY